MKSEDETLRGDTEKRHLSPSCRKAPEVPSECTSFSKLCRQVGEGEMSHSPVEGAGRGQLADGACHMFGAASAALGWKLVHGAGELRWRNQGPG